MVIGSSDSYWRREHDIWGCGGTWSGFCIQRSGIAFPIAQMLIGRNTLDDYEERELWTPSIGERHLYDADWKTYTKIGRVVHILAR